MSESQNAAAGKPRTLLHAGIAIVTMALSMGLGFWIGSSVSDSFVGPGLGTVIGYLIGLLHIYRLVEQRS